MNPTRASAERPASGAAPQMGYESHCSSGAAAAYAKAGSPFACHRTPKRPAPIPRFIESFAGASRHGRTFLELSKSFVPRLRRRHVLGLVFMLAAALTCLSAFAGEPVRTYENRLTRIHNPKPLLSDHPEFIEPVEELARFEAPTLVEDKDADLHVRAWRFSYNARGIIEMPNRLRASETAVIMVHPWGLDDGQGWNTPEPAGVADFCTPEKNRLAARHTREVINPFLNSMRGKVAFVMYSLPGGEDAIRRKLYRSYVRKPAAAERLEGAKELHAKLARFSYRGEPLAAALKLSRDKPVADYFKQFPGLDAGPKYNNAGFWDLPIPVTKDIDVYPDDVVIYDAEGYDPLKQFLQRHGVRHILLTGYATDMCFCRTTAGYENLSRDFNVFLVGDATLATFPANRTPRFATNAHISFAALNQLVTQISWIEYRP